MSGVVFLLWLLLMASVTFAVVMYVLLWRSFGKVDREIAALGEALSRLERGGSRDA